MKKSLSTLIVTSISLMLLSSTAIADNKTYIGSGCSYEYSTTSRSKSGHRFINNSGVYKVVTCPIVRDNVLHEIEYINMDVVGTTATPRLEARAELNGILVGWAAGGSYGTGGSGKRYYWFSGTAVGTPSNYAALALEIGLYDDAYINTYRVHEK